MEMCPACREIRNMVVSASTRTMTGDDGKEKKVMTLSYHCENCRRFVRSEDQDGFEKA